MHSFPDLTILLVNELRGIGLSPLSKVSKTEGDPAQKMTIFDQEVFGV